MWRWVEVLRRPRVAARRTTAGGLGDRRRPGRRRARVAQRRPRPVGSAPDGRQHRRGRVRRRRDERRLRNDRAIAGDSQPADNQRHGQQRKCGLPHVIVGMPSDYVATKAYPAHLRVALRGRDRRARLRAPATAASYYGVQPTLPEAIYVAAARADRPPGDAPPRLAQHQRRRHRLPERDVDLDGVQLCVDTNRIMSTGMSYGGIMSDTIGCQMPYVFRAIGVMSGALFKFGGSSACRATTSPPGSPTAPPIPTVDISGDEAARDQFLADNHCGTTTRAVDPSPCVSYDGCTRATPSFGVPSTARGTRSQLRRRRDRRVLQTVHGPALMGARPSPPSLVAVALVGAAATRDVRPAPWARRAAPRPVTAGHRRRRHAGAGGSRRGSRRRSGWVGRRWTRGRRRARDDQHRWRPDARRGARGAPAVEVTDSGTWALVWSDEFDADGAPSSANWDTKRVSCATRSCSGTSPTTRRSRTES